MAELNVLNSYWLTQMGGQLIGVVQVKTDYEGICYFIGTALGVNKQEDEQSIAKTGARLPREAGDVLMGRRF